MCICAYIRVPTLPLSLPPLPTPISNICDMLMYIDHVQIQIYFFQYLAIDIRSYIYNSMLKEICIHLFTKNMYILECNNIVYF